VAGDFYFHGYAELRYILNPKEVHGEDFPSETFRVLKEKEVKQFGDAPQSDEEIGVGGMGQFECRRQNEECRIKFCRYSLFATPHSLSSPMNIVQEVD
jgi:hypothetical protein